MRFDIIHHGETKARTIYPLKKKSSRGILSRSTDNNIDRLSQTITESIRFVNHSKFRISWNLIWIRSRYWEFHSRFTRPDQLFTGLLMTERPITLWICEKWRHPDLSVLSHSQVQFRDGPGGISIRLTTGLFSYWPLFRKVSSARGSSLHPAAACPWWGSGSRQTCHHSRT
jgi:hypothetical protein